MSSVYVDGDAGAMPVNQVNEGTLRDVLDAAGVDLDASGDGAGPMRLAGAITVLVGALIVTVRMLSEDDTAKGRDAVEAIASSLRDNWVQPTDSG